MLHQEKMAAFGLLAAGIAHEVGNPLTSISSLVQMLQQRDCDDYTPDKLALVSGQLQRIQTTLRELVEFSRPASTERSCVAARRHPRRGAEHRQVLQADARPASPRRRCRRTCRRCSASAISWCRCSSTWSSTPSTPPTAAAASS